MLTGIRYLSVRVGFFEASSEVWNQVTEPGKSGRNRPRQRAIGTDLDKCVSRGGIKRQPRWPVAASHTPLHTSSNLEHTPTPEAPTVSEERGTQWGSARHLVEKGEGL